MTKIVILIITAVVPFLFWAWKRYGGLSAEKRRLYAKVRTLRKQMRIALRGGHIYKYHHYKNERMQLLKQIRDIDNRGK